MRRHEWSGGAPVKANVQGPPARPPWTGWSGKGSFGFGKGDLVLIRDPVGVCIVSTRTNDRFTAGVDSEPQQPLHGFALLGVHVDDMGALATGKPRHDENRIFAFVRGEIAVSYACKLTQWHGTKMLGFDLNLCDELKTVTITAQGAIDTRCAPSCSPRTT